MSPDPENAGASLDAPQSWNAYSYVLNNPLIFIDPNGLDCVYLNDAGIRVQEVKTGDCRSETDNGYYVDGTIQGGINGVALTPDNNTIVYSYTNEDQVGTQYGHQCVGDCSGADTTVNVSGSVSFGTTAMSPTPTISEWGRQNQTFLKVTGFLGGLFGLPPEYCGPISARSEAPTSDPTDSTKGTEGQKRAQVYEQGPNGETVGPDGKPVALKYKNNRAIQPNPQGARSAETVAAAAGAASLPGNAIQCMAAAPHP